MPEAKWPTITGLPNAYPYLLVTDSDLLDLERWAITGKPDFDYQAEEGSPKLQTLAALHEQNQDAEGTPLLYGPRGLNHALLSLPEDRTGEWHGRRAWEYVQPFIEKGESCFWTPTLWAEQAGSPRDAYNTRLVLPYVALAYNWAVGWWTREQRRSVRDFLLAGAAFVWPETNPTRQGAWSIDNPHDNFYWGHLYSSTMAVLALYYTEDSVADDADRQYAEKLLRVVEGRWLTQALPWLEAHSAYLLEGTNYGYETWGRILTCLEMLYRCDPAAPEGSLSWRAGTLLVSLAPKVMKVLAHLTAPDLATVAPLGGQTRVPFEAPISEYHLLVARLCREWEPKLSRAWEAAVTPHLQQDQVGWSFYAWQRYLTADPMAHPAESLLRASGSELACFDDKSGLVTVRSHWEEGASQVVYLHPSTIKSAHQDRALGQVHFHAGGQWLLGYGRACHGRVECRESEHNNVPVFWEFEANGDRGPLWGQAEIDEDLEAALHRDDQRRGGGTVFSEGEDSTTRIYQWSTVTTHAYARRKWSDEAGRAVGVTPNEYWKRSCVYVPALDLLIVRDVVKPKLGKGITVELPLTLPRGTVRGGLFVADSVRLTMAGERVHGLVTWAKTVSVNRGGKTHRAPDDRIAFGAKPLQGLHEVQDDPQSPQRGNRLQLQPKLWNKDSEVTFWYAATTATAVELETHLVADSSQGKASDYWSDCNLRGTVRSKVKDTLIVDWRGSDDPVDGKWFNLGPGKVTMGHLLLLGLEPSARYEFRNLGTGTAYPSSKGKIGHVFNVDQHGTALIYDADLRVPPGFKSLPRKNRCWWLRKVAS